MLGTYPKRRHSQEADTLSREYLNLAECKIKRGNHAFGVLGGYLTEFTCYRVAALRYDLATLSEYYYNLRRMLEYLKLM